MEDQDFVARPYQVDLFLEAVEKNTIIYLPTGSGKTFIALQLLKYMSNELEQDIDKGGKRSVFLVNRVPLVEQQANAIRTQTFLQEVGQYTGAQNVDEWSKEKWITEISKHKVLVMTTQILINILRSGFINLSNINLIIMDDCHHACKNHPMEQLMIFYREFQGNPRPKILGLTDTLLNDNCKPENVLFELGTLEQSMDSTIATVDNMESVLGYFTNPRECIETYESYEIDGVLQSIIEELENFKSRVHNILFVEPEINSRDKVCMIIKDLVKNIKTLGAYGTFESAKIRHLEVQKLKRLSKSEEDEALYCQLITMILFVKKQIRKFLNSDDVKCMYNKSSPKLTTLFNIVKNYAPEKTNDKVPLKGIIFVEKRFTANILYQIFKALSRHDKEFAFIKPEFIVGIPVNSMSKSTEKALEHKWFKKALLKFRYGDSNLLIASNIVEEGLDIPSCTLVIRFDTIPSYCSYIHSKGRARSKESEFISMVCSDEKQQFENHYERFKNIEKQLCSLLVEKSSSRQSPVDFTMPTYRTSHAQATMMSAIGLVNHYFSSLPRDIFTKPSVDYFREKKPDEIHGRLHRVMIQSPTMSKIRYGIKGEWMPSLKEAKKSAALQAIEIFHKEGELDDYLKPVMISNPDNLNHCTNFFDHWLTDEPEFDRNGKPLNKPGTQNRIRSHKIGIPQTLQNNMIVAEQEIFLHVFKVTTDYNKPSEQDNRAFKFYNMLNSPQSYGILSAKPIPEICDFHLFLGAGKILIKLKTNYSFLTLNQSEINQIKTFNLMLYRDVLEILKTFLICDVENDGLSFLVCPVDERLEIDWSIIKRFPKLERQIVPSHQQRRDMVIDPQQYSDAIVVPWYRTIATKTVYVVTRVCEEMSPYSNFPTECFDSFNSYFWEKYELEVFHQQPMLEVKPISFERLNYLKPKTDNECNFNIDVKSSTFQEYLVPEFCWIIKYPAILYLKAAMLPSMLHRFISLIKARELFSIIKNDLELFHSSVKKSLSINVLCDSNKQETIISNMSGSLSNLNIRSDGYSSDDLDSHLDLKILDKGEVNNYEFELQKLNNEYSWREVEEPVDFHRRPDDMLSGDMDYYCEFISKYVEDDCPNESVSAPLLDRHQLSNHQSELIKPKKRSDTIIELRDMLSVLTPKSANDICDMEPLATLGDSFLKFAVTLYLTEKFRHLNVGNLTIIRGKIVGNKNLYYCGLGKKFPDYMNMYKLSPRDDWVPPGFTLTSEIKHKLIEKEISADVLHNIEVSAEEILSGKLLPETMDKITKCIDSVVEERPVSDLENILGILKIPDKSVADCVEALIGQFVLSYGMKTCLMLLGYLKVLPPSNELNNIMETKPFSATLSNNCSIKDIDVFIPRYQSLEKALGYVFKDRSYLLQALTHGSYTINRLTDSYQRLAFVGDSILDFLVTRHIYEHCGLLSSGELSDLRSALVNNNTFASLTVRYGFHAHLLALNPSLNDSINKFVSYQQQRGHKVDVELLYLLEEKECFITESVNIPKVLADIFESLACAVFLDSGKDLNVVWTVFYKLMNNEIKLFFNKVPKQVVRVLYESNCSPKFGELQRIEKCNKVVIPLHFSFKGKVHTIFGVGDNKEHAKQTASKIALQIMGHE